MNKLDNKIKELELLKSVDCIFNNITDEQIKFLDCYVLCNFDSYNTDYGLDFIFKNIKNEIKKREEHIEMEIIGKQKINKEIENSKIPLIKYDDEGNKINYFK